MTLLDLTPIHTGTAPFGSCYHQCVANLAAFKGLEHPSETLCVTWGFSWSGGHVLDGSGRWVTAAARLHRMDLTEAVFPGRAEAEAAERASLAAGHPVAAAVDAFDLPSPFQGEEHIAHCVLLLAHDGNQVWISDPMNRPEATAYPVARWDAMRSAPVTAGHRTFLLTSSPRHRPTPGELATAVSEDARAHRAADQAALRSYLAAREAEPAGLFDVAGVAAERLHLSRLFTHLAAGHPAAAEAAEGFVSLARRWYLLHTLSREAGPDGPGRTRLLRMLDGLADREARFGATVDALAATLSAS